MERLLTLIAATVACFIALLLPGVAAYARYQSLESILRTEAEINARLVTQLINSNPELWKVETLRLDTLMQRRPGDQTPEARTVFDLQGTVISEVRDAMKGPLVARTAAVHDSGRAVGTIRIQRSLRPLLTEATWFALLGLVLGAGVFAVLRVLPIRALRRAQDKLVHEATHDNLTGLPNRVLLRDRLEQAMARAQRSRRPMALFFIDLDNFKDINDSRGHAVGDQALRRAASLLEESMASHPARGRRSNDGAYSIARLGGDEFTVILESAGSVEDTSAVADQILSALQRPVEVNGKPATLTGSIGIAMYPHDDADMDALLRQADMAMYQAKELGRNTYHFFNDELNQAIQSRIALDQSLRGALERQEFILYYQPKADLRTGAIRGVEALLRWQQPGKDIAPPDKFIAVLEDNRLIIPIGAWVITTACEQLVAWDLAGLAQMSIAINLSARQFRDPGLADHISNTLKRNRLAPSRLELELTESLLMEDSELSRHILERLGNIGVRVAIDDFGTGHSSLAYLNRFAVDTLKIDRSFVRNIPWDSDNCAIASAVVALAHSLRLSVVCEGVENLEQVAYMSKLGCEAVQGYLIGHPMPADVLADWLKRYSAGDAGLTQWYRAGAVPKPADTYVRAIPDSVAGANNI